MPKKRVLFLIVCLGLLTAVGLRARTIVTAQGPTNNVVFKTPEEAITFYMQGVTQGNVSNILQACAINEMSEKFRLDLSTARLAALVPYQTLSPSDYPFYVEMNKEQLSAQILSQVKILAFSLLSTEEIANGATIIIDAARTTKFIKDVDPTRLTKLEVKKIGIPNPAIVKTAKYQSNMTKLAQVYGADEFAERVVLFLFEGNDYVIGFTVLRYGENWKIMSESSPLSNLSSSGAPGKITENDFENLIK